MQKQAIACLVIFLITCTVLVLVAKGKEIEKKELNELSEDDLGKLVAVSGRVVKVFETASGSGWSVCSRGCVNVYVNKRIYEEFNTRFDTMAIKGKRVSVQGIYQENGVNVFDANQVDVLA